MLSDVILKVKGAHGGLGHHERDYLFAKVSIRQAEHCAFTNVRVLEERCFDFAGSDFVAATFDQVGGATPHDSNQAIRANGGEISCVEPTVGVCD